MHARCPLSSSPVSELGFMELSLGFGEGNRAKLTLRDLWTPGRTDQQGPRSNSLALRISQLRHEVLAENLTLLGGNKEVPRQRSQGLYITISEAGGAQDSRSSIREKEMSAARGT